MIMFYLLAVVVASLRLGFRPALLTALLGVLAFDFFFIPPYYSFAVADTQYLITFAGLLTVGAVISTLVARARSQTETIRTREVQTTNLYALSRGWPRRSSLKDILNTVIRHVSETLPGQVAIFIPEGESLNLEAGSPGISPGEKEKSVALWAFRNGQMAGRGTETLSSSEFLYLPLQTGARVVGVMGIKMEPAGEELAPERRRLLEAFSNQAALAIERAYLAQEAERAQLLQATERLERSLLNSISHDLRTPLSSIMGTLSSLRDEGNVPGEESRRELIDLAWEEAERMNRFVGNLLDITRLEAGALKIKKELYDLQDLLGSCLASLESRLKGRKIKIQDPPRPSPHPHGLRSHGPGPGESNGKRPEIFSSRGDDRSGRPDAGKRRGNRGRGSGTRSSPGAPGSNIQQIFPVQAHRRGRRDRLGSGHQQRDRGGP